MAAFPSRSSIPTTILFSLIAIILYSPTVYADGVGLIGAGKWMYKPICAHACRRIIANCPLLCVADDEQAPHHRRHTHGGSTPPECFLKDKAFLRTMALCIAERCPRDGVPTSIIEDYWEGHLATGSLADTSLKPIMPYTEALMFAREDVEKIGEAEVPIAVSSEPLNQTSFISEEKFISYYNGYKYFEIGENGHTANSVAIVITTIFIPILASLARFIPVPAVWKSYISATLIQPAWGTRYRTPMPGNIGLMPTRGQALFIAYIFLTNTFLVVFPYQLKQPNYISESDHSQLVMIVGDRAGALAFANFVALFVFSARNNVLLWLTNWSHSTFLLLHRWVGYICIIQTVLHSVLMLYWYDRWADYSAESVLPYWYWGIVATLAICIMWPLSILPIRQRVYEIFLATHQVFAVLVLVTAFLHIWYLFEYNWGYEIWVYVAGGIWGADRLLRVARIARNGIRTANVSVIDESGEYLRVEIDNMVAHGHVYLYFPSLTWRFWESHPFSVLSSFSGSPSLPRKIRTVGTSHAASDTEKGPPSVEIASREISAHGPGHSISVPSSSSDSPTRSSEEPLHPRISLLLRAQTGTTTSLVARTLAAGGTFRLPVLVESSYHSNSTSDLSQCSTLLCIAGGVGITAVLPIVRTFGGLRTRLCWGVRSENILRATDVEMKQLGDHVEIETSIGARLPIAEILAEELVTNDQGDIGVVVCGPAGMADEVRRVVGEIGRSGRSRRGVVFIDEAFGW